MWYSALLLIILTAIVVYDLKKRRKERAEYKKAELLKGKNGADYMKEPVTLTPSGVVSRKIAEAAKREKRVIRTIVIFGVRCSCRCSRSFSAALIPRRVRSINSGKTNSSTAISSARCPTTKNSCRSRA